MKIPFLNLHNQYLLISQEIDQAISDVIKESNYIGGKSVKQFENSFAEYLNVNHVIGCANGTDSIEIILKALEIGLGDEVLVPALSWISTSEAVSTVGATPIFVDVHPDYYTINPNLIEEKITKKTKAIIPVHLYGNPAQMNRIIKIAQENNLFVIEDCAQAHAARYNNKLVGTIGTASSFSFYPGKNLGAYGDAGCIATNNESLAEKCRMLGNHGQLIKHNHVFEGRNSRLDGIQASVLNVKLQHLNKWTSQRQYYASLYDSAFCNKEDLIIPKTESSAEHAYHLYVLRSKNRQAIIDNLNKNGVETAIHYPNALPFVNAYKFKGYTESDFPVAFKVTKEIFSIPLYPELTKSEIEFIINCIINP